MTIHSGLVVGGNDVATQGDSQLQIVKVELDMADVASATELGATFVTGDSVTVLNLPEGTYMELIKAYCRTDLSGITQIDIGDEADDDENVAAATTLTAGTYLTIAKATHTDGPVVQAASRSDVKIAGTPSTGILELVYLIGNAKANTPAGPRTYTN